MGFRPEKPSIIKPYERKRSVALDVADQRAGVLCVKGLGQ